MSEHRINNITVVPVGTDETDETERRGFRGFVLTVAGVIVGLAGAMGHTASQDTNPTTFKIGVGISLALVASAAAMVGLVAARDVFRMGGAAITDREDTIAASRQMSQERRIKSLRDLRRERSRPTFTA